MLSEIIVMQTGVAIKGLGSPALARRVARRNRSRRSWGPFLESPETLRVSQFPLYLKNGEDLSRQILRTCFF